MSEAANGKIGDLTFKAQGKITRFNTENSGTWVMGPHGPDIDHPRGSDGGVEMQYTEYGTDGSGPTGAAGRLTFKNNVAMPIHVHLSAAIYDADGNCLEKDGYRRNEEGNFILDEKNKPIPLTTEEMRAKWPDKNPTRHFVKEYIRIDPAGAPLLVKFGEHTQIAMPGFCNMFDAGDAHSWRAVPDGIRLPDGSITGVGNRREAIMHFRYGEPIIGFTPVPECIRYRGSPNDIPVQNLPILFEDMSKDQICKLPYIWNNTIQQETGELRIATASDKAACLENIQKELAQAYATLDQTLPNRVHPRIAGSSGGIPGPSKA